MLLYVAGACDADEAAQIEAKLCTCCPVTHAALAEAATVFHAVPMALTAVEPPHQCWESLFGRVSADVSMKITPAIAAAAVAGGGAKLSYATRFRWPLYVSSGLAACLAVALTMTIANNRQMETKVEQLAEGNQALSQQYSQVQATLAGSEQILSSNHLSMARLQNNDQNGKTFGRVMFCPVSHQYQVTVFNLRPLPAGRAYELWLVTPDQQKLPAGMFRPNEQGTATLYVRLNQPVNVTTAAITDEPASGSQSPTGQVQLAGSLPVQ